MRRRIVHVWCIIFLLSTSGCGGCRDTAKKATQATVETVKDTVGGIQEGIDEGRKGAEGADGAVLVTTHDELAKYIELSIMSLGPASETGGVKVVLGVLSKHDKPVRMANLQRKGSLVLLDKNSFATHLQTTPSNEDSITVQPRLKEKFTFVFDGDAEQTATLRVYGEDYSVPAAARTAPESDSPPPPE